MKRLSQTVFTLLCCLLLSKNICAQPWMQPPFLKNNKRDKISGLPDFYAIQNAFNQYEKKVSKTSAPKDRDEPEEMEGPFAGYAPYKRWEYHMEPRVYPSGDLTLPSHNWNHFQHYLTSSSYLQRSLTIPAANWTGIGPSGTITRNTDFAGAGRVNFIRIDPVDNTHLWTASPTGGLWKSIDGGQSWTTNTDNLPIIGCSDIAIDPSNTQIMYLATGDANGMTSQLALSSIGILKSTDGGATWPLSSNTLNWDVSLGRVIYKLLIDPIHPDTVFAATSNGIYRTLNAGTLWTQIQGGVFSDIEFKPFHSNVVYAVSGVFSGGTFYKSTDSGSTFQPVSNGLPLSSDVGRLEIGVTPADSNYVYVVAVKKTTWDFNGFYRSTDGGSNFTLRANTPNILTAAAGAQAWYNLSMAVSPLHKDTILVGATNIWKTTDGGLTWVKRTSEAGGFIPYVHPDHHGILYQPGSDQIYYSANDGGIFKTIDGGISWDTLSEGLQIMMVYRLGTSPLDPNTLLSGDQDMGTQQWKDNEWNIFTMNTGDGMECIYEHDNDTIRYMESYLGRVIVTYNSYPLYNIVCTTTGSGVNGQGNWLTPIVMHPLHDSTLLIGKAQLWRTTNGGVSFTQVGSVSGGSGNLVALAYAESDPNYIYAVKSNRVFLSSNGTSFTDRTSNLPIASASITAITVCNTNPQKAWVTFSGYSSANKVWYTTDAGLSWTNRSAGLPNLPVNCILYQKVTDDGLYVGTDVGVYFIDNSYSSWQSYFNGLPNVDVEELDIAYSIQKIRAATNGRSVWQSDLAISVPASLTWVGSISSEWNNPGNWMPHAVPTAQQNVIIPDVVSPNHDPVVNVPGLACKNLTLQQGANMIVPAGNEFKTLQ